MTADDIRRIVSSYVNSPMLVDELCHALAPAEGDRQWNVPGSTHPERLFAEWLNEQRMKSVSEVFHDIVRRYREALDSPVQPKHTPTDEQWRDSKYGQEAAKLADDYRDLMRENAGLREQLAEAQAPAPAPRFDFEDLRSRVMGAIHDHGSKEPEDDETWEEWHAAAFDLLGAAVARIFDAAQPKAGAVQAPAVVDGWRPIDTAPKDGSMFLCWVAAERWSAEDGGGSGRMHDVSQVDFCWWRDNNGNGYFDPACGQIGDREEVTHWMPLPEAPKDQPPVQESGQ